MYRMTEHDFTGKSIKCDTWEQMEHLAKLAEEQEYKKFCRFDIDCFNRGERYFTIDHNDYMMINEMYDPIEISYTDFITPTLPPLPTEVVEVTGCEDCPFSEIINSTDIVWCNVKGHKNEDENPFNTCPLKKASLTIQLKHYDTTIIHTNIVCQ